MRCIAVLDVLDGQVVHAVRGDRANYTAIRSTLCATAAPLVVAAALRDTLGIAAFYVADLAAIQRRGSSREIIAALIAAHRDCEWWIDADFGSPARLESYLATSNVRAVIGSESLQDAADFAAVRAALPRPEEAVLSLDHRGGRCMGPAALHATPALWPTTVIAMNLDRVGAGDGPDLALIARLRESTPHVVAAGGVRDARDLATLHAAGVSDVLLASALHDGRLGRADLARW